MRFDFEDVFWVYEIAVSASCGEGYTKTATERFLVVLWASAFFACMQLFVLAFRHREAFFASLAAGLLLGRLFLTGFAEVADSVKGGGTCTGADNPFSNEPCGLCAMMFFICTYWLSFECVAHKPTCCRKSHKSESNSASGALENAAADATTALRRILATPVSELVHPTRKTETIALLLIAFGHSVATVSLGFASKRTVVFSACVGAIWCGVWTFFVYVSITPVFHEPWFQKLLRQFRMETRWFRTLIAAPKS